MRSFERSYRLGCRNETIIKITLNYNSIEGHIQVLRHKEDGETSIVTGPTRCTTHFKIVNFYVNHKITITKFKIKISNKHK